MKNLLYLAGILVCLVLANCSKDTEENEYVTILTEHVWKSDSLLANGVDASAPGQLLENFKGDARFNKDNTGTFGKYEGTWWFTENYTQIRIRSDSLKVPYLTCKIIELIPSSFKITTAVPDTANLMNEIKIRMTFKPK
ncbi:MAG: hypothetical protein K0B11_10315 [Mariniphaga sp.]|nr:hypothetical protein [Mariniphaga sp.]